jgi:hypothetical protein
VAGEFAGLASAAMASHDDVSKENLFVQLVTARLKSQMDDGSHWDDYPAGVYGYEPECPQSPDSTWFAASHSASSSPGSVLHRMDRLEAAVLGLHCKMNTIIDRLPALSAPQRGSVPQSGSRLAAPMSSSRVVRSARSRGSSSSVSPMIQHEFVCPLCCKPQQTPKSHCEHIRNIVADGYHHCRLDSEHTRHAGILAVFGSAEAFVSWYDRCNCCWCFFTGCRYCGFLRSGMGSKFTAIDVQQYDDLQLRLIAVLERGSLHEE